MITRSPAYETEEQIVSQFNHKNVSTFLKVITGDKQGIEVKFTSMPIASTDFENFIKKKVRTEGLLFDIKQIRTLFSKIVAGVEHIHQKGWAHRDLRPENILLFNNGCNELVPKIFVFVENGHRCRVTSI
jgi:serine/threonine protein kinase